MMQFGSPSLDNLSSSTKLYLFNIKIFEIGIVSKYTERQNFVLQMNAVKINDFGVFLATTLIGNCMNSDKDLLI